MIGKFLHVSCRLDLAVSSYSQDLRGFILIYIICDWIAGLSVQNYIFARSTHAIDTSGLWGSRPACTILDSSSFDFAGGVKYRYACRTSAVRPHECDALTEEVIIDRSIQTSQKLKGYTELSFIWKNLSDGTEFLVEVISENSLFSNA